MGHFRAPDGKYYKHAVIHCYSHNGKVKIEELEGTDFKYYCEFTYISLDLGKPSDGFIYESPWTVLN